MRRRFLLPVCAISALLFSACLFDPAARVWIEYSGSDPLYVGQTMQFEARLSNDDADVEWSISSTYPASVWPEKRVATVDSGGIVTLRNYGSFTVSATTGDFVDSVSYTFFADPEIVGTWNGAETLVLHKSGILDVGSTQSGAWYTTETQIFLEYDGTLRNYQLVPGVSLDIDFNGNTVYGDPGESFVP